MMKKIKAILTVLLICIFMPEIMELKPSTQQVAGENEDYYITVERGK